MFMSNAFSRYTSFTGCAILLYSATQKLLTFQAKEVSSDLLYASSHLNLLSLCSYNSSTARELYSTMQVVFNDIRDILVSPHYSQVPISGNTAGDAGGLRQPGIEAEERFQDTSIHVRGLAHRMLDILQQRLNF
jgi:hypothetical protein